MTLQQHFNLIKEGKGNKAQFLKQARLLFPEYINQYSDFDSAARVLKSKQIINEAVGGVVSKGFNIWDWKKILAEEVKAEEKKTSKEVEDANKNAYDNTDMKNADNINFNEIMKGFYAELKDEKNNGKTGDEIKAIAVKNLAKDPLYYTKNGEFGVKGLGYTTEAPGLGTPKEAKGKYKSSGYGDLDTDKKIEKAKANVQDSLGDKEAKTSMPSKVKEMEVTPKSASGVKRMPMPGAEKKIKLQESLGEQRLRSIIRQVIKEELNENIQNRADAINSFAKLVKTESDDEIANTFEANKNFPEESDITTSEMIKILKKYGKYDSVMKLVDQDFTDPAGGSGLSSHLEESKLRSLIQQVIKEELNENYEDAIKANNYDYETAYGWLEDQGLSTSEIDNILNKIFPNDIGEAIYQGTSIKLGTGGSLGGRRFIPNTTVLSRDAVEAINAKGAKRLNWGKPHIKIVKSGEGVKLLISKLLIDTIVGSERGRSKLSLSVSKMGTGITPEEMSELTGEFKKLVKVLNAGGKLTQNGDYYLLDVPTKYNEDKNQYEMPLPNQLEEELNEGSIEINGKTVKTYTQNGDTSYNVTYDDGTKDIIYVNNDGWDEINQLHRNAIGDDAYRKQFSKK